MDFHLLFLSLVFATAHPFSSSFSVHHLCCYSSLFPFSSQFTVSKMQFSLFLMLFTLVQPLHLCLSFLLHLYPFSIHCPISYCRLLGAVKSAVIRSAWLDNHKLYLVYLFKQRLSSALLSVHLTENGCILHHQNQAASYFLVPVCFWELKSIHLPLKLRLLSPTLQDTIEMKFYH